MVSVGSWSVGLVLSALSWGMTGCGPTLKSEQAAISRMHEKGDYAGVVARLEAEPTRDKAYGKRNLLLWTLEYGCAQFGAGDHPGAVVTFDEAESYTAYNYDQSKVNVIAQWALNQNAAPYMAQPYEDMYVNVFKQLAYLREGDIRSAAVESNRLYDKSQSLGHISEAYLNRLDVGKVLDGSDPEIESTNAGRYVTSPLGAYLASFIYAKTGNVQRFTLSNARLRQSLDEQRSFSSVDPAPFSAVEQQKASSTNLVVVAFSGRSARKEKRKVELPFIDKDSIKVPLPRMVTIPSVVTSARVEVRGAEAVPLHVVEDIGSVVAENYRRAEPLIYARTAVRWAIKLGAVLGATYGIDAATESDSWAVVTAFAGFGVVLMSEAPDLRSWIMLPGRARVASLELSPGEHQVRVVYAQAIGSELVTPWETVSVGDDLKAVVTFNPQ